MWRVWLLDTKYPLELVFRQKLSLTQWRNNAPWNRDGKQKTNTGTENRKCCKLNLRNFGETKLVFVKLHKLLKTIKLRIEFYFCIRHMYSITCIQDNSIDLSAVSSESALLAWRMHEGGRREKYLNFNYILHHLHLNPSSNISDPQ